MLLLVSKICTLLILHRQCHTIVEAKCSDSEVF
jgi:hypothetical protein